MSEPSRDPTPGTGAISEVQLVALERLATTLGQGIGTREVIQSASLEVCQKIGLDGLDVWCRIRSGKTYRRITSPGEDTEGAVISNADEWLLGSGAGRLRLQLRAGAKRLGLVEIRFPTQATEVESVAPMLAHLVALWLAATELSRDLASEVSYRTQQIDAHRRFTSRIIDSLPVGLYVVDRGYRIRAWNRKREEGWQGVPRQQALGRYVFDVLTRQPPAQLKREFDTVFETGRMEQIDVEAGIGNDLRHFRITKIPMRLDNEQVTHVITIGEDVTEWKTIQRQISQTEKLAAVGQLAAGVMHELNNPLATIGACVEALTARVPDLVLTEQQAFEEYLRIVDSELERCNDIINGLLDFSHPKAQKKEYVLINQIVEDALFLFKHHDRIRRIELVSDLAEGLAPVYGNAKQLIQVFLAIMLNAIDAMEGRGDLTVTTGWNLERDDEIVVTFEDTGGGIERDHMDKIFEPFFTTKLPGRGTGLGLSICYAMVQEHRGRVQVDSQVGMGTTIRVFLPTSAGVPAEPSVPS